MGDRESSDRPEFIPDQLGRKGENGEHANINCCYREELIRQHV
jgi:hypothetical protein